MKSLQEILLRNPWQGGVAGYDGVCQYFIVQWRYLLYMESRQLYEQTLVFVLTSPDLITGIIP